MPVLPIDTDQIVITASRSPESQERTAASVTIIDSTRIERLGEPLLPALLRLTPSTAVTAQGPAGLLTEVRIRGAENNHTLLFIDGIRANDPAGGDFPRFELLNADLVSRLEVVRGPQSALWGSSAIGGVVAVNGLDGATGRGAGIEAGSFGFLRANASASVGDERASLAAALGWQRADGIDSVGASGDRDGYRNLSARVRGSIRLSPDVRIGLAAFAIGARAQFDGYPPPTFERGDSLDESRNRLGAGRLWVDLGRDDAPWRGRLGVSTLAATNRNRLADDPVNRTRGTRSTFDAQLERRFATARIDHRLTLAAETERETFRSRDTVYGGFTDQDRSRGHQALTGEWRAASGPIVADVALRRDRFNRFRDATTVRASLLGELGGGLALAGSYAQGIAPPTFFDLYGFFPGNYVGNPSVEPESSRGFEGSLRYRRPRLAASLTVHRQRLHDEIVENASFTSVVNAPANSRRWGIEAEAAWLATDSIRLTGHYAYLRSTQPGGALNEQLEEWRRPRHSGALAVDGSTGRVEFGASLAFVGSHLDRQEVLPYAIVRLRSYVLANARLAYALRPGLALTLRATNLLDEGYEDSAGYRTEGRGLFVGLSLPAGRRSLR